MRTRSGQHAAANERRVVVLPFENQGDSSRQYFANGVTEAITTELTGIGGLNVIPRSTAARYRGTPKTVSEIGRELGVGYVLTGTVQWDLSPGHDPKVRVSPELIRVADTSSVWAHGYEAVLSSVFQVYSDVSTEVARSLKVTLDAPERRALARRPTENPEGVRPLPPRDRLQQPRPLARQLQRRHPNAGARGWRSIRASRSPGDVCRRRWG